MFRLNLRFKISKQRKKVKSDIILPIIINDFVKSVRKMQFNLLAVDWM